MHAETFAVGPLGCNCTILADVEAKRAIVIDPGGDYDAIRARLDALGVSVEAIVHTHTHSTTSVAPQNCSEPPGQPQASTRQIASSTTSFRCRRRCSVSRHRRAPRWTVRSSTGAPSTRAQSNSPSCTHQGTRREAARSSRPRPVKRSWSRATRSSGADRADRFVGRRPWDDPPLDQDEAPVAFPDEARVVTGHGGSTTIGDERARNPYLESDEPAGSPPRQAALREPLRRVLGAREARVARGSDRRCRAHPLFERDGDVRVWLVRRPEAMRSHARTGRVSGRQGRPDRRLAARNGASRGRGGARDRPVRTSTCWARSTTTGRSPASS